MPREIDITRHGKAVVDGEFCSLDCPNLSRGNEECIFYSVTLKMDWRPGSKPEIWWVRCPECLAQDQQGPQWKDAPDQEGWWWLKTRGVADMVFVFEDHLPGELMFYAVANESAMLVSSVPHARWYGPIEPPAENGR